MKASIILIVPASLSAWVDMSIGVCKESSCGLNLEVVVMFTSGLGTGRRKSPCDESASIRGRSRLKRNAAEARAAGVREASGDVLVFVEGLAYPTPGAIDRLVEALDPKSLGAGGVVVAPRISAVDEEGRRNPWLPSSGEGFFDMETFDVGWIDSKSKRPCRRETPVAVGGCMAIKKHWYEHIGGFDGRVGAEHLAYVDVSVRTWLAGGIVLFDSSSLIGRHFPGLGGRRTPRHRVAVDELRVARKVFGDEAWDDWVERFRRRHPGETWEKAWDIFQSRSRDVEAARSAFGSKRARDEYWFASLFGLDWPTRSAATLEPTTLIDGDPPAQKLSPDESVPSGPPSSRCSADGQMKTPSPRIDRPTERSRPEVIALSAHELLLRQYASSLRNRRRLAGVHLTARLNADGPRVEIALHLKLSRSPDGQVAVSDATFEAESEVEREEIAYLSLMTELLHDQPLSRVRAMLPEDLEAALKAPMASTSARRCIDLLHRTLEGL